ncbi:MvaI/BcnI family restriction endonuclease [Acinetobacter courvalinii]|uniref:MvaI/BcnI family restriction endonuclease n=1 Tax=Acinetobacter courvalinii TaxID=280147 RepID=UPI00289987FA|nr:MvaI/BcnI family restriction endonuclease [Acinetobacter courvalinii]
MSQEKLPLKRSITRLKDDAKKLKKEKNIQLSQAQDLIAQTNGYSNWQELVQASSESDAKEKDQPPLPRFSNGDAGFVLHNRQLLAKLGIDYSLLAITATGLTKSIMDAVSTLREYFILNGYHNYQAQEQGIIERKPAKLVTSTTILDTQVSLYRPKTKLGDPRIWVYKLNKYAEPNDTLAFVLVNGFLYVFNISKVNLESYENLLATFVAEKESIALELLEKLKSLAKKGPLKAIKNGDTAIGMTIEHALGIEANSLKTPDYKGIELKSAREKAKAQKNRSTIFAQVADWKISPLKNSGEIVDKYGYMRETDLKLYCTINTKMPNPQGLQFEYRANEDLLVEKHIIDGDIAYWQGAILRARLLEKHKETFWIQAESIFIEGHEYFILKSVIHTKNPLIGQFMQLLDEGIITMDHLIKRKNKTGAAAEKGPLFKINPKNLMLLFPETKTYFLE